MKLPLQKRTNNDALVRKSPRMYYLYKIAVRTKWQSSHIFGDSISDLLKGNRIFGNEM